MLESLIKRLNEDDINEMKINALFENVDFTFSKEYSDEEIDKLESALECVDITNDDSLESSIDRLVEAAADPDKILTESVVSTSKSITITTDDYNAIIELAKNYSKLEGDEKSAALKKFKSFVNSVSRSIRKCNDDNPADAKILAVIKKLCRIFDTKVETSAETRKAQTIETLNALKKSLK